jgi:hypothetical protein
MLIALRSLYESTSWRGLSSTKPHRTLYKVAELDGNLYYEFWYVELEEISQHQGCHIWKNFFVPDSTGDASR